MSQQNDLEMQYQSAEPMSNSQAQQPSNAKQQEVRPDCLSLGIPRIQNTLLTPDTQNTTAEAPKRTFLGMRGGGIICKFC